MDIKDLQQIITILKQNEVTEFELDQEGTHIKLCRGSSVVRVSNEAVRSADHVEPAIVQVMHNQHAAVPHGNGNGAGAIPAHFVKVESPIVGTFYRRPSPDSDPFVKEGDQVKKGDTLCIIEAMKVMNEIEAPASGRLEKILLTEGQVVEFGESIFFINPQA